MKKCFIIIALIVSFLLATHAVAANNPPVAALDSASVTKGNSLVEGENLVLDASDSYDPDGDQLTYTYRCNQCTTVLASGTGLSVATIPYAGGWDQCTPVDNRGINDICVTVTDPFGASNVAVKAALFNIPLWQIINKPAGQKWAKMDYSFASRIVDEGGAIGERMYTYFDLQAKENYLPGTGVNNKELFGNTLSSFRDFFVRREPQNTNTRVMMRAVDASNDMFTQYRTSGTDLFSTFDTAVTQLGALDTPLTKDRIFLTHAMLPGLPAFYRSGTETTNLVGRDELPVSGTLSIWSIPDSGLIKSAWSIRTEQAAVTVAERAHRAAALLTELSTAINDASPVNNYAYSIVSTTGTEIKITESGPGALGRTISQLNAVTSTAPYKEEKWKGDAGAQPIMTDLDIIIAITRMYQEVCLMKGGHPACPT